MIQSRVNRAVLLMIIAVGVSPLLPVFAAEPPPVRVAEDESYFFRHPETTKEGALKVAEASTAGKLRIVVHEAGSKKPCPSRINVIGSDGNFYHPVGDHLTPYAFSGEWPKENAKGNRREKAPYRYLGRFFYSDGDVIVAVPPGEFRVEVSKGLEFKPLTFKGIVASGETKTVELEITRTAPMATKGYFGGDLHLHLVRSTDRDDETIFDLLDAEDIWYGTPLGYNEPAGPYSGFMEKLDYPQFRGLGSASIKSRGAVTILSGQEYRSGKYGHLNLYLRDRLVLEGQSIDADHWPVFGLVGAETQSQNGYAFHAHGGYALEVYADAALGTVSGIELLQFGIYRGIGLTDWYHMLNTGYRFPCVGASDFPACRFLGDCRTYIWSETADPPRAPASDQSVLKDRPSFANWLRAAADGKSFVTTGPLLLLDVAGKRPGEAIVHEGNSSLKTSVNLAVRCEVTPVTHLDLIMNGRVIKAIEIPASHQKGEWFQIELPVEIHESSWIAARAWSTTPGGQPDAESHTNPVYVSLNGRKPYQQSSLDAWILKIDTQMDVHRNRTFAQKSKVLDYFQRARDLLLKIREQRGLGINDDPTQMAIEMERAGSLAQDVSRADATDEELREFLKPVPAKSPTEAVKSFDGINGFQMQLVAAEPLVSSPIATAFDEDANLYVCEMRDYPYKPGDGLEPIGRIRMLRDTNNDGVYDEAHVFADKLLWAAGVVPWKGGIFVAAPPNIWYFKDTDGDHQADLKRKVFTGFGIDNQQAMVNNLQLGMDHWIYGSTAGNGGMIRPGDKPDATPISVKGRDFRFDPVTEKFETVTGTVQFGNTFDDWGNRFVCSESQPLLQVVLPEHYLARNPFLPSPGGVQSIAPYPVPIYRISPIERWRQIRSSRRIATQRRNASAAGASHHVIDAAAGVTIYRGGAYPAEYYGQAFVGDGQNNLIHRRALSPNGVVFKSDRVDEQSEFLRSPDIWFRPVNLINAPDGTLYCCDMSREFLESIHIPLDVVKHLDLKSGRDNGRIYRIAPPHFQFPKPPHLSRATVPELVAALESPHVWWRETALRLLHERQDASAIPALRRLVRESTIPQARLLALWSLEGLQGLDVDTLLPALSDQHPGIRENAVRLAESRLRTAPGLLDRVVSLADDETARVRFQVAFSLGETEDLKAIAALSRLAHKEGSDQWIRTAILSSVSNTADKLFAELIKTPAEQAAALSGIVNQLAHVIGVRNHPTEIKSTLNAIAESPIGKDTAITNLLLLELGRGSKRSGRSLVVNEDNSPGSQLLRTTQHRAEEILGDANASIDRQVFSIELLSCSTSVSRRTMLSQLLSVERPEPIQLAAIRALGDDPDPGVGLLILSRLPSLAPDSRRAAMNVLLSREAGTLHLLKAASQQEVSLSDIDQAQREILIQHKNPSIRELAVTLFGAAASPSRKSVVDHYRVALQMRGDTNNGKAVFLKNCSVCHQLEGKGSPVGPNLASNASREPAALLTHILDPNQHVQPNFLQYIVVDKSGRTYTGLLAGQTATSVTLKKERDELVTILRGDIDEFISNNKSLMPEGLEKEISHQAMADLIAYLNEVATQNSGDPNAQRDTGTLPGLIETSRD